MIEIRVVLRWTYELGEEKGKPVLVPREERCSDLVGYMEGRIETLGVITEDTVIQIDWRRYRVTAVGERYSPGVDLYCGQVEVVPVDFWEMRPLQRPAPVGTVYASPTTAASSSPSS